MRLSHLDCGCHGVTDCGCHGVGDCGCHGVADCGCHGVAEWKWKVSTTAIKTIVIHHLSQ